MTNTTADLAQLLDVLDLSEPEPDTFLGAHARPVGERTFGGQILAPSLIAAGRSVASTIPVQAMHTHFIRGGDVTRDITYRVERLRDARAYANREVRATQDGMLLAVTVIGFQRSSSGLDHGDPIPSVADPESLPRVQDYFAGYEDAIPMFVQSLHPIDMRFANDPSWIMRTKGDSLDVNRVWLRADGPLPDLPLLHAAVLAYASDTTILDSIITRHGLSWGLDRFIAATLNQSIWFHRPVDMSDFNLYSTHSPVAAGGRGTAHGQVFSGTGSLVASTTQEGVIKYFRPRAQ